MTKNKAVAKARRELEKILISDYTHLSNEDFRIGKLQRFIAEYNNSKGKAGTDYDCENTWIEKVLDDILTWDKSQLNKHKI